MGTHAVIPQLPSLPTAPGVSGSGQGILPNTLPGATGPSTGVSTGLSTVNADHTVAGDFTATYGQGTGTALINTLAGLGTSTSNAVQATNQSILDAAGRQQANLQATNAAHGLSTDSSASALSLGDFNSQVTQQIASTDANMELQEENTLIQSLFKEGQAHGGDSSFMGSLGNFFEGGGLDLLGAAGSVADALPGTGGTGLGNILDVVSGL